MFAGLQGAPTGASPGNVTVGTTRRAAGKTSEVVWDLTEIA